MVDHLVVSNSLAGIQRKRKGQQDLETIRIKAPNTYLFESFQSIRIGSRSESVPDWYQNR